MIAKSSIWIRKLDLLYLAFFTIHVPIMLLVDLVPLYPIAIRPQITVDIRTWYIATYKDRFFTNPTTWFRTYMLLEAVYHIPLSLWAVPALLRDDLLVPLHLLIWACETALTTLTCVVEAMSWEGFTGQEKVALAQLYVPYLLLCLEGGEGLVMHTYHLLCILGCSHSKGQYAVVELIIAVTGRKVRVGIYHIQDILTHLPKGVKLIEASLGQSDAAPYRKRRQPQQDYSADTNSQDTSMSQFRGGPRYSDDTLGYRDAPPRWDADRFTREREIRYNGPVITERERPIEGHSRRVEDRYATPPRREEPRFEEKFYTEERYGPPARRVDRQYYEEDEIYSSRPPVGGAMVPFRRPEAPPPPRPGIIRRQSSLDTFDRRAPPRFEEYGPPPRPRYAEPLPPRAPAYAEPRYTEREYDDTEYRYKEREWVTRKRDDSGSPGGFEREEFREEVIEEVGEREKPFPRRGKTRMPRRLVSLQVLYDLRYPFHEEGDVIVIEKALGKENIDEVVGLSKSFRERETTTVHLIEAPPAPPAPPEIREEIIEKVETLNISDAPRSVREWDHLSVRSPSPARTSKTHHSHRSRSRKPSRSRRGSSPEKHEKIIDVHSDVVTVREVSPSRTAKSHKSHRSRKSRRSRSSSSSSSSSNSRTRIIERREVIEFDQDESNSVHVGPLALVVQPDRERRKSRSDRDIQAQIRELEEERRKLERERKDRDVIRVKRGTIVRDVDEEEVEVKKKKAPSAGMMRAMLATLT